MEGECKTTGGSAHAAAWCGTHDSLLETCQFRRIAALEAEVQRLHVIIDGALGALESRSGLSGRMYDAHITGAERILKASKDSSNRI